MSAENISGGNGRPPFDHNDEIKFLEHGKKAWVAFGTSMAVLIAGTLIEGPNNPTQIASLILLGEFTRQNYLAQKHLQKTEK